MSFFTGYLSLVYVICSIICQSLLDPSHNRTPFIVHQFNYSINMESLLSATLKLLSSSIMIRMLLAVLTIVMVYALAKLAMHCWGMRQTFRGLPHHPNTHWLWGHAHLVYAILIVWHASYGVFAVVCNTIHNTLIMQSVEY